MTRGGVVGRPLRGADAPSQLVLARLGSDAVGDRRDRDRGRDMERDVAQLSDRRKQ